MRRISATPKIPSNPGRLGRFPLALQKPVCKNRISAEFLFPVYHCKTESTQWANRAHKRKLGQRFPQQLETATFAKMEYSNFDLESLENLESLGAVHGDPPTQWRRQMYSNPVIHGADPRSSNPQHPTVVPALLPHWRYPIYKSVPLIAPQRLPYCPAHWESPCGGAIGPPRRSNSGPKLAEYSLQN